MYFLYTSHAQKVLCYQNDNVFGAIKWEYLKQSDLSCDKYNEQIKFNWQKRLNDL